MTKYTTKLLCSQHELDAIRGRWAELRERRPRPALELHPDWLMLEAQSKPGATAAAIALYEGPELVGVAPFLIRPWQWKCRLGYAQVASFPVRLGSLCGDEWIAPDDPMAHEAMLRAIAERNMPCDMVYFADVPTASTLWRALNAPGPAQSGLWRYMPAKAQCHWLVRLAPTFDAYLAKFPGKRRIKLKNNDRRIDKHAKEMKVERITAAEQIPAFLAHVEHVSTASWQGTRLEQIIHNTVAERDRLVACAERGWVRSYLLLSGDECIAFVIGMQLDGVYVYDRIGYDPAWAPHSPGKALLFRILQDLHAYRRPEWLDFGTGDAEYKRFFGTESFEAVGMYLLRPSAYIGIARAVNWSLTTVTDVARRSIQRLGIRPRVMRLLRRGDAQGRGSLGAASGDA